MFCFLAVVQPPTSYLLLLQDYKTLLHGCKQAQTADINDQWYEEPAQGWELKAEGASSASFSHTRQTVCDPFKGEVLFTLSVWFHRNRVQPWSYTMVSYKLVMLIII